MSASLRERLIALADEQWGCVREDAQELALAAARLAHEDIAFMASDNWDDGEACASAIRARASELAP